MATAKRLQTFVARNPGDSFPTQKVMADSAASNQIPGFISNPRYGLPAVANLRKTAFDGKSLSGF